MRMPKTELLEACLKRLEELPENLRSRHLVGLGLWGCDGSIYKDRLRLSDRLPFHKQGALIFYKKDDVINYVKKYGVIHPLDESKFDISQKERREISDRLKHILEVGCIFAREVADDIGIAENTLLSAISMSHLQHPRTYQLIRKYLEKKK